MVDDHDNKDLDKKMLSLIKDLYQPENQEQDEQEFEVFFRNLEDRLENDTMHKKVSGIASDLEHQFLTRQQRLFQAKNRFESGFFEKKENKFKQRKIVKTSFFIGAILLGIGLTSIATLRHNDAYKVIDFEKKNELWSELNLTKEQKKKIEQLDAQWKIYSKANIERIQVAKAKLNNEINQASPDLSLVDKYQREIFELEQHLKKQKFNTDLEKRFLLNEKQSLMFVRESNT
jgi:Spy/CpxP family protein refolding chaperone